MLFRSHQRLTTRAGHVVLLLAALMPMAALGVCTQGHPSVKQEMADSHAVVIGEVTAARDTLNDAEDAGAITATVYTMAVKKVLAGHSPKRIDVVSENTSSRFPMDVGRRYIAFVRTDGRMFYIDNCGSSSVLADGGDAMAAVLGSRARGNTTTEAARAASAACARIVAAVSAALPERKRPYYCEPYAASRRHTVVAVRSCSAAPAGAEAGWTGSNLVGYFALHRASGSVSEWDIGEGKPVQAPSTPPGVNPTPPLMGAKRR